MSSSLFLPILSFGIITLSISLPIYYLSTINNEEKKKIEKIKHVSISLMSEGWFLVLDSEKEFDGEYIRTLLDHEDYFNILPRKFFFNLLNKQDFEDNERIKLWTKNSETKTPYWFHLPNEFCYSIKQHQNELENLNNIESKLKEILEKNDFDVDDDIVDVVGK